MHVRLGLHTALCALFVAAAAIIAAGGLLGGAHNGQAAAPDSATFTVSAPASSQPLNTPFQVPASLTVFTPGNSTTWGGYDFELAYDNAVLKVDSDARGLCSASGWGPVATSPHVVTGCAFQTNTTTGVIETITFECIANGSSTLRLVPRNDPSATQVGTALFDESGNDFLMTLQNTSVTCGSAATSTATNTATNTPTSTATNTPTATRTPTATNTPTNTPLVPNTPTNTPTARPTYTPITGPVNLRGEWSHYNRCPVDDPAMLAANSSNYVGYCVAAGSGGGSFKLGNTQAQAGASNIQFGLAGSDPFSLISPAGGAIESGPVDVPGGLLGLMCPSTNVTVLAVCNLITNDSLNRVTATVQDAGPPSDFNFNAGTQIGVPLMTLPIKVHLENPLLGSTCYIGSDASPIVLRPAGITNGLLQIVRFRADGTIDDQGDLSEVVLTGAIQGDNTFAVPGVTGCGALGVLDTAINLKTGLPSAAGNNSVVLTDGASYVVTFADHTTHFPNAGLDFQDDWHAAICNGPCGPAPTPTPSATATATATRTATPTPVQTAVPVGCVGDTDCDGCPDAGEAPRTNPTDPWDFYSVPVPALFAATNPLTDFKDSAVTPMDAQAIFAYFRRGARTGTADYEADLNQNGVKDGVEYDRSVVGPGHSGAPDGAVTSSDAQLAFAQYRMGYRC